MKLCTWSLLEVITSHIIKGKICALIMCAHTYTLCTHKYVQIIFCWGDVRVQYKHFLQQWMTFVVSDYSVFYIINGVDGWESTVSHWDNTIETPWYRISRMYLRKIKQKGAMLSAKLLKDFHWPQWRRFKPSGRTWLKPIETPAENY